MRALTRNKTKPRFASDLTLEEIAGNAKCEKFSGADLSALIREASLCSLQEVLDNMEAESNVTATNAQQIEVISQCVVSRKHFENAFKQVRSSVTNSDFAFSNKSK